MTLPQGFNEYEHLQDLVRREHNKAVNLWFRNQPDNDLSKPKSALKHACLIKDNDTSVMTMMRLWLFEVTVGRAQAIQTPVYGIPVQELQSVAKFKPQIKLFFREDYDKETHDTQKMSRLEGEITFRLVNESSSTITRTQSEQLARVIKNAFTKPNIFTWEKGWFKCTYLDYEKGYDLRLLVKSKAEGEKVVKQVLSIQNHSFERENFQFIDHDKTFSVNPGTHRVYGKTVKKPTQRRRSDVKFRYAQLLIWGQPNPVNLVSVGGRFKQVIERV